jgi:proteic killer suppression protein
MPTRVEFRPRAYKSLRTLPGHIVLKLKAWIAGVELLGLREIRKRPGFHDEPLHGDRRGQRSIRLSRRFSGRLGAGTWLDSWAKALHFTPGVDARSRQ